MKLSLKLLKYSKITRNIDPNVILRPNSGCAVVAVTGMLIKG